MLNPKKTGFTVMSDRNSLVGTAAQRLSSALSSSSSPSSISSSPVVSTSSTPSSPITGFSGDTGNTKVSNRHRPPCFWALLSNCDLKFVYVSQSIKLDCDKTELINPSSTLDTNSTMIDSNGDHVMTDTCSIAANGAVSLTTAAITPTATIHFFMWSMTAMVRTAVILSSLQKTLSFYTLGLMDYRLLLHPSSLVLFRARHVQHPLVLVYYKFNQLPQVKYYSYIHQTIYDD
ncbi:hypothetical protein BDF19DRAFT_256293 [Syncephalis fuscata]|nr:hypothetical protein BDF19DRAFT_256293 [Syncephalis fuscata]